jgi:hypothetical protein
MRPSTLASAALLLALSTACGGGAAEDDGTDTATGASSSAPASTPATATSEPSPAASPPPAARAECPAASPALVARIEGLAPAGSGLKVLDARGYQAEGDRSFFVAVRFTAPGLSEEGEESVYAVTGGSLDGTGALVAVDNLAQEFYDGPDAQDTDLGISPGDPRVREALDACL